MVTPTLGAAFTKAIEVGRNLGPRGMPVTLERVDHVFEDSRIEVLGVRIPVVGAGLRGLRAGDKVAVSWQAGRPVAAIRHSARRSGAVTPNPRLQGALVEELIYAPAANGSSERDYWFRNGTLLNRLGVSTALGTNPSAAHNTWGLDRIHFVARSFAPFASVPIYHVFVLEADGSARTPDQIITTEPTASLVRSYDPRDSTLALGTFTTIYGGGTFTHIQPVILGPLLATGYSSGDGAVKFVGVIDDYLLDDRGHLLLSLRLVIIYFYDSVLPNWGTTRPYIVDLTDNLILYNGTTDIVAAFGVTVHNPVLINLDTLPRTPAPPPQGQLLDPFGQYGLFFLTARDGVLTLLAGAGFQWAVSAPAGAANPPLFNMATQFGILGPTGFQELRPFTFGTSTLGATDGIYFIGSNEDYLCWLPFSGVGGLQTHLPFGAIAAEVRMTKFTAPVDEEAVGSVAAWFAPQLRLLEPDALYDTRDSNEIGHAFVAFQGELGAIELDADTPDFPPRESRGPESGFLLDYPEANAFIPAFLADTIGGLNATDAYAALVDVTDYQLILDTAANELPV
jgi:hypothetical protein